VQMANPRHMTNGLLESELEEGADPHVLAGHPEVPIGPVFITGASGMLGLALTALCNELLAPCYPYPEACLDITNGAAVEVAVSRFAEKSQRRGVVVNAAAYTDVERAETNEERAFAVNDQGARNVAEAAARNGLDLIHVSTDFVFDGSKGGPYTEQDLPNPLSVYGRSKLAGEQSAMIAHPDVLLVRTAWVYGPGGSNFPRKILQLARRRDELQVVADEFGSPTASWDLARAILQLRSLGATGLFHVADSGLCSRFEVASEVVSAAELSVLVTPVPRGAYPTRATRPANSSLCLDKASRFGVHMPDWRVSLQRYVRSYLA
jgi:dTDP-4-dehydrorhamnose reductase